MGRENIIIPDGPRKGQPFKILREPWRQIAKAITSPRLEQITIRASVQSGKTALLIAAALYFMAMGKSVLFFEPNDNLKRRMQKRIRDWGMSSSNEEIVKAWTPMRSPFYRVHENGGSLEIIGGQEHGAGLARTAEIVLVDELRAFTMDLLQEITDRMAAFGGKGRLITASFCRISRSVPNDCRVGEIRLPAMVHEVPQLQPGKHRRMGRVSLQERSAALRHAVLWGDPQHPSTRWGCQRRTLEADREGDRSEDARIPPRLLQRISV